MIPSRGGPAPSIHVFLPPAHTGSIVGPLAASASPPTRRTAPTPMVESVYPGGVSIINIPGLGSMEPLPALDHLDLLAPPVAEALTALAGRGVATASSALVAAIDPDLTDTEIMTEAFGMDLALSSNCILVAGKRLGEERIAACVVRASTNADINHVVKNRLDVRKASFWPQERAVAASGMEYGGITPVGVPASWRLLIDSACASGWNCIGSGLRRSKLFVTGQILAALPGAEIIEGLGI